MQAVNNVLCSEDIGRHIFVYLLAVVWSRISILNIMHSSFFLHIILATQAVNNAELTLEVRGGGGGGWHMVPAPT